MAERGAHLTAADGDAERPSIFQLLAQESLMEAVRPALRHAAKVLAEAHPSSLGFLWRSYEELYLLLDLLLQSHLLSTCSASFSENFYGLKRVPRAGGGPLSRAARGRSLLLLCLLPYLLRRLRSAVSRRRDQDDFSIPPGAGAAGPRLHTLHRLLACGGSAWAALRLAQTLLYVGGRARTHSPLLWLAGVRLAPLTARDLSLMRRERPAGGPAGSRLVQAVVGVAGGVAASLSTALSLGTFFLQFLEWWYSADHQDSIKSLTSLPAPPPPLHLLQPRPSSSSSSSCCPLCGRLLSNHTVLSTSGYVFCYRCIYAFVKTSQRCPLSGYPTQLQHLVKIYSP